MSQDCDDDETDFLTDDEAVARPRTTVFGADAYPDLATKSAAMFESLVRSHPLLDGNKRLAVVLTWVFLLNNGFRLEHTEDEAYDFTIAAASGELTLQEIREWLSSHLRPA